MFLVKMGVYSLAFVYVILDLYVFKWHIHRAVEARSHSGKNVVHKMNENNIAAFVYRVPIYLTQVDYEVSEKMQRLGVTLETLPKGGLKAIRRGVLEELIDDSLLRVRVEESDRDFPIAKEAIDAAVERFNKRFVSMDQRQKIFHAAGIDGDKELRMRMEAMLQQDAYLEKFVEDSVILKEDDVKKYYDKHKVALDYLPCVQLSHIFLAHLDHPHDGEVKIKEVYAKLGDGVDFVTLADEYNEDPATKGSSGDLGWVAKDRLPKEIADSVFAAEIQKPYIFKSKMGWHVILVTAKKATELRSYAELKDEIESAMRVQYKADLLKKYREQNRLTVGVITRHLGKPAVATHTNKPCRVEIFEAILDKPFSYPN